MQATTTVIVLSLTALMLSASASTTRAQCPGDLDGDQKVTITEIIMAVNSALNGCTGAQPTPTATPCALLYTCTCAAGCGFCGVGGDPGQVRENVPCELANDICLYKDGPCNNPNLHGCDGSRVFVHGWTCVPNP